MKVKIYGLYNPQNNKIRYIGRTKRELRIRLNEHVHNAKFKHKNKHLYTWIRKLLKQGIRPKIKLLQIVDGWENSHKIERCLINKFKDKHNLVNANDRGEGNLNRIVTKQTKLKLSNSLKKYYSKEENKINFYNKIYCYDINGNFYKEYKSSIFACKELNINRNKLSNHINKFDNYNAKVNPINNFYFSKYKLNKFPVTDKYQSNHRPIELWQNNVLVKKFSNTLLFAKEFNLSQWDIYQLRNNLKTKKLKEIEKHFIIKRPL